MWYRLAAKHADEGGAAAPPPPTGSTPAGHDDGLGPILPDFGSLLHADKPDARRSILLLWSTSSLALQTHSLAFNLIQLASCAVKQSLVTQSSVDMQALTAHVVWLYLLNSLVLLQLICRSHMSASRHVINLQDSVQVICHKSEAGSPA